MIILTVLLWRFLGFPLALAKAKRGHKVVWIGCEIEVFHDRVLVRISAEKVEELASRTADILKVNVVGLKTLRRYAGLANFFASVLYVWRPFLAEIWAAMQAADAGHCSGAPPGCVWTKTVAPTLAWISAFLAGSAGTPEMECRVALFLNRGLSLRIVGDALI